MADDHGRSCSLFDAGACLSCTLMPIPHVSQVEHAELSLRETLQRASLASYGANADAITWEPPITSEAWGFRTRAKMAVAGSAAAPILTSLDAGGNPGVDLAHCPLYPPLVTDVLESAREVLRRAQIAPYSVKSRKGEAKYVLVTASEREALVRFVVRSEGPVSRLREHAHRLDPRVVSASATIQPLHAALIDGDRTVPVSGADRLHMQVGPVRLGVLAGSFTQTNLAVSERLYATVAQWILDAGASRAWDLYCGVGGFALRLAYEARERGHDMTVTGVEIAAEAIRSARDSAADLGVTGEQVAGARVQARFDTANATAWASAQPRSELPDALVVNPPRRGLGPTLAEWINNSEIPYIAYSSCNPRTLGADLTRMGNYRVSRARLVDMFPHTAHDEAVIFLERRASKSDTQGVPRG